MEYKYYISQFEKDGYEWSANMNTYDGTASLVRFNKRNNGWVYVECHMHKNYWWETDAEERKMAFEAIKQEGLLKFAFNCGLKRVKGDRR